MLINLIRNFPTIIKVLKMGTRENRVERHLNSEVLKLGGISRKWVSPGVAGVPDRIVIVKGHVWFVEVKTFDGQLSPIQSREIQRLKNHGASVHVVHGEMGVDTFIKLVRKTIQG